MKKKEWGSALALGLPFLVFFFFTGLLLIDVGRISVTRFKALAFSEKLLLSHLAIRVESLEGFAEKAKGISSYIKGADENGALCLSKDWGKLAQFGKELKSSLSGYKGRSKSIETVIREANGLEREDVLIFSNTANAIPLSPVSVRVRDEQGVTRVVEGLWIKRAWGGNERLCDPKIYQTVRVCQPYRFWGMLSPLGSATIVKETTGELHWDVQTRHPFIQRFGNGGYPRRWEEALAEGNVDPYRVPFYGVLLKKEFDRGH